jgi:MFS superfamily sulfate permease-like transporter
LNKPFAKEGFMFWTVFLVVILLSASIGIVAAIMLSAAKRRDVEEHLTETSMGRAGMDEIEEFQKVLPPLPEPLTYLDRYPHA